MKRGYMPEAITTEWYTPPELFAELDQEFNFTLDPCATPQSALCDKYLTKADSGLSKIWSGRVFMNPPYGRGLNKWVKKAYDSVRSSEAELVVALIPSSTETLWFHEFIYPDKAEIRFLKGRVKFLQRCRITGNPIHYAGTATKGSMVVIWRREVS